MSIQYLVRARVKGQPRATCHPFVLTSWLNDNARAIELANGLSADWVERQIVTGRDGVVDKVEDLEVPA